MATQLRVRTALERDVSVSDPKRGCYHRECQPRHVFPNASHSCGTGAQRAATWRAVAHETCFAHASAGGGGGRACQPGCRRRGGGGGRDATGILTAGGDLKKTKTKLPSNIGVRVAKRNTAEHDPRVHRYVSLPMLGCSTCTARAQVQSHVLLHPCCFVTTHLRHGMCTR